MERPHVKEEILSIQLEITWKESMGHLSSQYASLTLLSSPIQLIFPFPPHPKNLWSHWWLSSLSCLVPWMFDTCQRSKRGLLSLSCYLRDLSLPHSWPSLTVLLCYQILSIPISLSLSLLSHRFTGFGSWRACSSIDATTSSHLIIQKLLWRVLWRSRLLWICHSLWGDIILNLYVFW